jgi:hypothetical protein
MHLLPEAKVYKAMIEIMVMALIVLAARCGNSYFGQKRQDEEIWKKFEQRMEENRDYLDQKKLPVIQARFQKILNFSTNGVNYG